MLDRGCWYGRCRGADQRDGQPRKQQAICELHSIVSRHPAINAVRPDGFQSEIRQSLFRTFGARFDHRANGILIIHSLMIADWRCRRNDRICAKSKTSVAKL